MHTQPGSKAPVTYDPCQVIEVEINPDGAPEDYREYVDTAIEHVSGPSGLRMEVVGETDERPSRTPRTTGSFGWKPVLVAWADEEEVPELAGDVAGLGGSLVVESLGRARYVTGTVTLDAEAFQRINRRARRGRRRAGDHRPRVRPPGRPRPRRRLGELMYADNIGRRDWVPAASPGCPGWAAAAATDRIPLGVRSAAARSPHRCRRRRRSR